MGKKQKKNISKKNHNNDTLFSIKKTIKIDFISNKKQKNKNLYQIKNLNPTSKIFIPKKFRQLNSSFSNPLINKSRPIPIKPIINSNDNQNIPKWMSHATKNLENSYERFNQEIIDYVNYVVPHNFSLIKRQYTVELLTHIIEKYDPNWKVILYGSFSQNISTIFSDLDLAIYNNKKFSSGDFFKLFYIMNVLQEEGFSQDIEFINARIPILRGTCINTGIKFDISFNKRSGLKAADLVRNIIDSNLIVKQAVIFIKILLKINDLNETYTGGMCSFLVFHLVYYYYTVYIKQIKNEKDNNNDKNVNSLFNFNTDNKNSKYYENSILTKEIIDNEEDEYEKGNKNMEEFHSNSSDFTTEESSFWIISDNNKNNEQKNIRNCFEEEIKIGDFLLGFLKFYGFEFDYKHYGFSINEKNFGKTFQKVNGYQESSISVESIEEEEIDIGIKCFNYDRIVDLFQKTYFKIKLERDSNIFSILDSLEFPCE